MLKSIVFVALIASPLPALAEGFAPVREKSEFMGIISGKALTRFGISLNVSPAGEIQGSAFGSRVTGNWSWENGLLAALRFRPIAKRWRAREARFVLPLMAARAILRIYG